MSSSHRTDRRLGGLLKHSAVYSAAPVLRQIISVGMTTFYTRPTWLDAAGYGVKEVVDLFAIGLQQILGQNILGSMVRFYFDRQDEEDQKRVVTSCTLLVTLAAWLVCGAAFLFSADLAPVVFQGRGDVTGDELVRILQLVLLLVPFQLSTIAGMYYLQILKRSGLFTTIQTVKLLFEVGLNFYFIGALGLGVRGFLLSMLAGEALTSLALTGWMLVTLRPRIDLRVLRPILIYALPLLPVGLCQLALHQIDRWLINNYWGQDLTGIYGLGYRVSYLVTAMMLGPFIQIFHPWIFEVSDRDERARLLARVSTYAVLGIGGVSLGIILFGRQATIVLAHKNPEMWAAFEVIPFVTAGYVFWALYHVSQMPLFIAKRTSRLLGINLAAVVINVGLNLWMIPRYGIVGAGITTCTTFFLLAVLGMVASRSESRVPFELKRIGLVLVAVVAGGALALAVDHLEAASKMGIAVALALKGVGCTVLLLGIWFGVLRKDERRDAVQSYRKIRGKLGL